MNNQQIRILLIEDNSDEARLIEEMLLDVNAGSFVMDCTNRLSAGLERLSEGKIDVVLLDLTLPDSSGFDTFLKVQTQVPELPIIVLTNFDNEALAVKEVRKGAQDYLLKREVTGNLLMRSMQYAIERKQTERHILHLNNILRSIRTINKLIVIEKDKNNLVQKACNSLVETRDYNTVWMGLVRFDGTFAFVKSSGFEKNASYFCQQIEKGNLSPCIKNAFTCEKKFEIVNKDKVCEGCFFENSCLGKEIVIIRVEHSGKLFGLLTISSISDVVTTEEEKDLLLEVAGDIAFALHDMEIADAHKQAEEKLKENYQKLQKSLEDTIRVLALVGEIRDPYTAGHQRRVAQLACAIAKEMKFSKEQINTIRMAGIVHDIGKMSVPAEILSKPSKLDESEMNLIKRHPQFGYEILKDIEFPWPIAKIVLQHHERLNGSGYPLGLTEKDIMLEAKILSVTDVVEAMASHRPYRPALGIDKALEEICRNKGVFYDTEIVDMCLKLFNEKKFKFK